MYGQPIILDGKHGGTSTDLKCNPPTPTLRERAAEHCKAMNELCALAHDIEMQLGVPPVPATDRATPKEAMSNLSLAMEDAEMSCGQTLETLHRILQHVGKS